MADVTRCTKAGCGRSVQDPIHWPSTAGGHTFQRLEVAAPAPRSGWGVWKFLGVCAALAGLAVLAREVLTR